MQHWAAMTSGGMRRVLLAAVVLAAAMATAVRAPAARAADDACADTTAYVEPAPSPWMGANVTYKAVRFPARTGACLAGVVFGPSSRPASGASIPAVALVPGTGGDGEGQWWAAHFLAAHGYAVVLVAPQGEGKSDPIPLDGRTPCMAEPTHLGGRTGEICPGLPPILNIDNYADAITAGLDYLLSPASPYRVDPHALGAGGHSQGARGASLAQDKDRRIRAIVAFDNLSADAASDDGAPSGGGAQGAVIGGQLPLRSYPITPRAPAMGHSSDGGENVNPDPDVKKTAYDVWRGAGVPAYQMVFKDYVHGDWSSQNAADPEKDNRLHTISRFTLGWFDLWLRGRPEALEEVSGRSWSGVRSVASTDFHSAAFLPGQGVDCGDLATCAAPAQFRRTPVVPSPPLEIERVQSYWRSFQDAPHQDAIGPRTATSAGGKVHEWFAEQLLGMGLRPEVRAFAIPRFTWRAAALTAGRDDPQAGLVAFRPRVFPLYYSGSTGAAGVTAPLVDVGRGSAGEFARTPVKDAIAVVHLSTGGPAAPNPIGLPAAIDSATSGGAKALVVAVDGPGNEIGPPNRTITDKLPPLPVLLMGWEDGERLRALDGQNAKALLDARIERHPAAQPFPQPGAAREAAVAYETSAVIPGTGPGVVVLGTPLNGWFNVASERGSGIAVLLEVARRLAVHARSHAPAQTIVIVGHGGHEIEAGGVSRFMSCIPADRLTAYVHLGATVAGITYPTDDPGAGVLVNEPTRALYVSENPMLQSMAADAFGVARSGQVMRMAAGGVANPGEQAEAYAMGIPIVAISGASRFFHTRLDTPDKTAQILLRPMSNAFDTLMQAIVAADPAMLRSTNAVAGSLAAPDAAHPGCPPLLKMSA